MSDPRVEQLRRLPIFGGLDEDALREVAASSTPVDLPPDRVLCRQGDIGRECFLVVDGEARITRDGKDIARVGAGDLLGEIALLDGGHRRTATVTAITAMRLLVLDPREFDSLLRHTAVAQRVHDAVAERLRSHHG